MTPGERRAPATTPAPPCCMVETSSTDTSDDKVQRTAPTGSFQPSAGATVVDLFPRPQLPAVRRTQEDREAIDKLRNIARLVEAGAVDVQTAWPWLLLELGSIDADHQAGAAS